NSASVWPPSPSVVSTSIASRSDTAGSNSSNTRSTSTGRCVASAAAPSTPAPSVTTPPFVASSFTSPIPTCDRMPSGCGPDTGEVASGPQPHAIRSEHARQDLLLRLRITVLVFLQVGPPGPGVPDLQPRDSADDHALLGQSGVAAQFRGDRDATLSVRTLFLGAREQVALVRPHRLIGERRLSHSAGQLFKFGTREDEEAMILSLGDHQPTCQRIAELRRQREPPLVVQLRGVGAEEHRLPPPADQHQDSEVLRDRLRSVPSAPQGTTVPHFPPQSTPKRPLQWDIGGVFARQSRGSPVVGFTRRHHDKAPETPLRPCRTR